MTQSGRTRTSTTSNARSTPAQAAQSTRKPGTRFRQFLKARYAVPALTPNQAAEVQAYFGLKEMLGLKAQQELNLRPNGKSFNWSTWTADFAKLYGQPLKLTVTAEELAQEAIANLPQCIGMDTDQAFAYLVESNQAAYAKRSEQKQLAKALAEAIGDLQPGGSAEGEFDDFDDEEDEALEAEAVAEGEDDFDEDDD
jgi:hypothetical protein